MFGKRMSDAQKRYAQYYGALHYNGAVPIHDKIVKQFADGYWVEFPIQPTALSRTYRVLIVYINGYQPFNYIINPNITELANRTEEIPHLYSQEKQRLCLTFPDYHEWHMDMLIVNTYIPWLSLWLYYFEEWLLSNEWKGGGVHPGDEEISSYIAKESKITTSKSMRN